MVNDPHTYDPAALSEKWLNGTITPEEKEWFEKWYASFDDCDLQLTINKYRDVSQLRRAIYARIRQRRAGRPARHRWLRLAVAAAILVAVGLAGSYWLTRRHTDVQVAKIQQPDIEPGSDKAILTLDGGRRISLTDAPDGLLASQGQTVISKTGDGSILYHADGAGAASVTYNTISTPRGGKWHVTLPDGTLVWLDAFSSIRFPSAFTGSYRAVAITGQAYFEVAHNAAMPFRVSVAGQTVEVLGTHFNINAYSDETAVRTTLLEGSIRISKGQVSLTIRPGQQAGIVKGSDQITVTEDAHAALAVAWKDGYFRFQHTSLQEILRQLSRWYDIEVVNNGVSGVQYFNGRISRNSSLSKVLKVLQLGGVHFEIAGKQLILTP